MRRMPFIPNIITPLVYNIFEKINMYGKKYECIRSYDCETRKEHVQKGEDDEYKYPLRNTSGNPFLYFSSRPHKNQYDKKVLLSNSGRLDPKYDEGRYGTTDESMYILVDTKLEGVTIVNTLNSNLYRYILRICSWSNFRNEKELLDYLKYPSEMVVTDNDVNNYFRLTNEEISLTYEAKTEAKTESKTEAKTEAKTEEKTEGKPEVKTKMKPKDSPICRAIKKDGVRCSYKAKYRGMCGIHKKYKTDE
jgi:Family of unknown function (DUF5763)